jgi:hypothetical protein
MPSWRALSRARTQDGIRFCVDDALRNTQSSRHTPLRGDSRTALATQPFSTLSPGSEFGPAHLLAPLLLCHPIWAAFSERITDGAEFPLVNIPDAARLMDVTATLARGNHKSALGHEAMLLEMLKDKVKWGWQLPLPNCCEVAPLGMVLQTNIGSDGAKETKLRLTCDQLFNASGGMIRSVNDRVVAERLMPPILQTAAFANDSLPVMPPISRCLPGIFCFKLH